LSLAKPHHPPYGQAPLDLQLEQAAEGVCSCACAGAAPTLKVESALLILRDPQVGQLLGTSPALRTNRSNRPPQPLHSYSKIGM